MTCKEFLFSILASLIAAGIIILIQQARYFYNFYLRYNDKIFDVFWKGNSKERIYQVRCSVKRSIISYEILDESIIEIEKSNYQLSHGEFIMDPINLKIGTGYHVHEGYDGFNFPKIVIKDKNTFFVETTFTQMKKNDTNGSGYGEVQYRAFVWKKI